MNDPIVPVEPAPRGRPRAFVDQAGKIGLAILMWFLGVPGFIILLYLLLG
jgi:hypothetical protein